MNGHVKSLGHGTSTKIEAYQSPCGGAIRLSVCWGCNLQLGGGRGSEVKGQKERERKRRGDNGVHFSLNLTPLS